MPITEPSVGRRIDLRRIFIALLFGTAIGTGALVLRTSSTCGDGAVAGAEICDDGDTTSGDGCSATCTVESGWECSGAPSSCDEVCGDGLIVGAEACDDDDTDAGDGCSATCTVESGWSCPVPPPSTPSSCFVLDSIAVQDATGNNWTCGEPNEYEGATRAWFYWTQRVTGAVDGCPSGFDIDAGATNSIVRYSCFNSGSGIEIRFQVGNGTARINCDSSDFDWRFQEWTRVLVCVDLVAGTVRGYNASYSGGRVAENLTCSGALPAAFDSTSVTAQLEFSPGALATAQISDWTSGLGACPATDQQVWDYMGDETPANPAVAPWGAVAHWYRFGDGPADTTTSIQDQIGVRHCTGSSTGFLNTHLPRIPRVNTKILSPAMVSSFMISDGTEDRINLSNGTTASYGINPNLMIHGRDQIRYFASNGATHTGSNHRIHYGHDGPAWPWGWGVDYPWSTVVETVVEPSQAPVATNLSGGPRGPQLLFIHGQHDSQEGSVGVWYNVLYSPGAPQVRVNAARVTDFHLETPTWAEDRTTGVADDFFPVSSGNTLRNAIGGSPVELPNGDALFWTYGNNLVAPCNVAYQVRRWRSTGPHVDNTSWAHEALEVDSCNDTPGYKANEPDAIRYIQAPGDGTPNIHGRVYLTFKADDVGFEPPNGAIDTALCIYTDSWAADPTDTTPDWRHCGDGSAAGPTDLDWSLSPIPAANHTKKTQLSNGAIALTSRFGKAANHGSYVALSTDRGATWNSIGNIGPATTEASTGDRAIEIRPNVLGAITTYERSDNPTNRTFAIYGEIDPDLTDTGPLTWSNAGWCRVNDGGVTDEYLRWGVYPHLQGKAQNAVALRFRDNDGGADEVILSQWGAAGGDQSFRMTRLASGAVRMELGAYLCETAAGALGLSATREIGVRYNGGTPALLIDVDGANVACDQNVVGTVPTTWPASTARIRLGVDYDDADPCTSCFFDEVGVWDEISFDTAAKSATCLGADLRTCDVDGDADADWPTGYVRCEGENAALSAANGCAISENWGYHPVWVHGINTECSDTGATP